tara:strand:- start:142 stop:348 length:207 start_codon:yes stop_codon:yes gene_type:complete
VENSRRNDVDIMAILLSRAKLTEIDIVIIEKDQTGINPHFSHGFNSGGKVNDRSMLVVIAIALKIARI